MKGLLGIFVVMFSISTMAMHRQPEFLFFDDLMRLVSVGDADRIGKKLQMLSDGNYGFSVNDVLMMVSKPDELTVLEYALTKKNRIAVIRQLLEFGAKPNSPRKTERKILALGSIYEGWTACHIAVRARQPKEVLALLYNNQGDFKATDTFEWSPIELALHDDNRVALQFFSEKFNLKSITIDITKFPRRKLLRSQALWEEFLKKNRVLKTEVEINFEMISFDGSKPSPDETPLSVNQVPSPKASCDESDGSGLSDSDDELEASNSTDFRDETDGSDMLMQTVVLPKDGATEEIVSSDSHADARALAAEESDGSDSEEKAPIRKELVLDSDRARSLFRSQAFRFTGLAIFFIFMTHVSFAL